MRGDTPENRGRNAALDIETAEITRTGNRRNNQDRHTVMIGDRAVLLGVADGMGGHSDGAGAAEAATRAWAAAFRSSRNVIAAPVQFLQDSMQRAHLKVVEMARGQGLEHAPRTTGVMALIHSGSVRWIHAGDSRAYLLRDGEILKRSRDHSVVEELVRRGQISEDEARRHPMRHYVETCLGGDDNTPGFRLRRRMRLLPGDIVLLCSDGFWGPLDMDAAAQRLFGQPDLQQCLEDLAGEAEQAAAPRSDNITAVALRWGTEH